MSVYLSLIREYIEEYWLQKCTDKKNRVNGIEIQYKIRISDLYMKNEKQGETKGGWLVDLAILEHWD